eukprot:augustus_masked-scaffold_46-processed-gene-1.106-mRNA-1 protein AED:1.00 eAED:1.00 QI:0/0/0/0/1/1/3/0/215
MLRYYVHGQNGTPPAPKKKFANYTIKNPSAARGTITATALAQILRIEDKEPRGVEVRRIKVPANHMRGNEAGEKNVCARNNSSGEVENMKKIAAARSRVNMVAIATLIGVSVVSIKITFTGTQIRTGPSTTISHCQRRQPRTRKKHDKPSNRKFTRSIKVSERRTTGSDERVHHVPSRDKEQNTIIDIGADEPVMLLQRHSWLLKTCATRYNRLH